MVAAAVWDLQTRAKCPFFLQFLQIEFLAGHLGLSCLWFPQKKHFCPEIAATVGCSSHTNIQSSVSSVRTVDNEAVREFG